MAVFERNCLFLSRGDAFVKQHPQHCEKEQDDEEDLPVHGCDGHAVEGAAADQSAAQNQDVDADDPRQEPPAAMMGPLHDHIGVVKGLLDPLQIGGEGRAGQVLDVVHLCCSLNVGGMALRSLIFCFSTKKI